MRLILSLFAAFVLTASANAEPSYKLTKPKVRVIEVSGLADADECTPATMSGRVIRTKFDDAGVWPTSVTIEDKDGERLLINIEPPTIETTSRVALSWIQQGLQTMLKKGRKVSLGVMACGASGRVLLLDSVRSQ